MKHYLVFEGTTPDLTHECSHIRDWFQFNRTVVRSEKGNPHRVFSEIQIQPVIAEFPKTKKAAFDRLKEGQSLDICYRSSQFRDYLYLMTEAEHKNALALEAKVQELAGVRAQIASLVPKSLKDQEKTLNKEIKAIQNSFKAN